MTNIQVQAAPEAHGPKVIGPLIGGNIGRMASLEEQASAIVFLASNAASDINGVILRVDDGWSAV